MRIHIVKKNHFGPAVNEKLRYDKNTLLLYLIWYPCVTWPYITHILDLKTVQSFLNLRGKNFYRFLSIGGYWYMIMNYRL